MGAKKRKTPENSVKHSCSLCPYATKFLSRYKSHSKVHSNEKPFKCLECPFKAKKREYVKHHVKNVHLLQSLSSRPFPCPHSGCNYAAKLKGDLKRHSKIHSDEPPEFSCTHQNCSYATSCKEKIIEHIRIHTGEKPFACKFESCSYAATRSSHLVLHTRIHTKEKPYKCPQPNCEYSATCNSAIKKHQLIHHPRQGEESSVFKCPLCEYKGKNKENLVRHIKSHTLEKRFKCDEPNCAFEAKTKSDIKDHKLIHCDDKPFACPVDSCQLTFKRRGGLVTHLKTHSDERQYKCELCPFRGKQRSVVTSHLKNIHSDPDFRPFKCTEPKCSYTSKLTSNLNRHLLIHKRKRS